MLDAVATSATDAPGLSGKVALVTGGGGGIGAGVSRRLAAAGAQVVLLDIDRVRAEQTRDGIRCLGGRAHAVIGDVCDRSVVNQFVAAGAEIGGGRIDILVNNVGDYRPWGPFVDSDEHAWELMHDINFRHVLRCTKAVLPTMLAQSSGSIVNVTTVEALRADPTEAVYSGYKAAVMAFTRSLAVEVASKGIRVNAIAPDMTATLQIPAEEMLAGRPESDIAMWVPLGRFGQPEDSADVVVFLAGDGSRFVTGITIPVDGGTLAAGGWYRRASGDGWTVTPDRP